MAITPKERGNIINYYSNSGNLNETKSSGYWRSVLLTNDGASDIVLTINSIATTVKSGETFDEDFVDFNTFTLTASVNYRLWLRE